MVKLVDVSTHPDAPQMTAPAPQLQAPELQMPSGPQVCPHAPQLVRSEARMAQFPAQLTAPTLQADPHAPPVHVGVALAGVGHVTLHAPQLVVSVCRFAHTVPQLGPTSPMQGP